MDVRSALQRDLPLTYPAYEPFADIERLLEAQGWERDHTRKRSEPRWHLPGTDWYCSLNIEKTLFYRLLLIRRHPTPWRTMVGQMIVPSANLTAVAVALIRIAIHPLGRVVQPAKA
jgi:hypothetical protein